MSCTVRFEPSGLDIEVEPGRTLLDAAREAGIALVAVCGGRGTCGKCRVRVLRGPLPPETENEKAALSGDELGQGWRLACEYPVTGPMVVQSLAIRAQPKTQGLAFDPSFVVDPPLRRWSVDVPRPSLEEPIDDEGNLRRAIESAGGEAFRGADIDLLRGIPGLLRDADWSVTASISSGELVGLRASKGARPAIGCAIDLGTTNLAAYLHRMDDGELLGVYGAANPLASYGADIVTRLGFGEKSSAQGRELQALLIRSVNLMVAEAGRDQGYAPQDIEEMVAVGNSGMHHLFLDLPGRQLIRSPYIPAARSAITVRARELGVELARGAFIYLPPLVGGFVGSDLLAVALSCRMDRGRGIRVVVDIGTNTEVLLSVDGKMYCCSTASGPALEGAALRFGTVAVPGAIDRMWVEGEGRRLAFTTLEGRSASGICGSGILDALRCLRELGDLSSTGRLRSDSPRVHPDPSGDHRCVLARAEDCSLGEDLSISQMEIRSVQLAKGAIRAGIDTLLSLHGIEADRVDEFLIAGSFGNHLDIDSAVGIGLFPRLPPGRFRQVGNAAGTGAGLMLLSVAERRMAEEMSASIVHIELSLQEGFRRRFATAQWFPEEIA